MASFFETKENNICSNRNLLHHCNLNLKKNGISCYKNCQDQCSEWLGDALSNPPLGRRISFNFSIRDEREKYTAEGTILYLQVRMQIRNKIQSTPYNFDNT